MVITEMENIALWCRHEFCVTLTYKLHIQFIPMIFRIWRKGKIFYELGAYTLSS